MEDKKIVHGKHWSVTASAGDDIEVYREMAVEKRQSLRKQYARLRLLGGLMATKGWVRWKGKGQGYGAPFFTDRSYKERETIKTLFHLQENIAQQAMLLLELEWTCDCLEEKRNNKQKETNDDTDKE